MCLQQVISKRIKKKSYFFGFFKATDEKARYRFGVGSGSGSIIQFADPSIWTQIRLKMSRIRNTAYDSSLY